MSLKEFLALLAKNRKGIAANRVGTADHYVRTLQACTGPLCPAGKASIPPDVFATALKRAASTPVYRNQDMGIVGALKAADASAPAGLRPVAVLDYVATSRRQDRDSDILEPKGCVIDPAMPFLWQHDATAPIGRLFATVSRDENAIQLRSGIADTPLGNDAAYLAEFGALRISHGFRPQKFEPLAEKNGEVFLGFHVLEYEMMETSLVSVPSNTDAIITAFSREKLGSPVAKSWAKGFSDRRQRFVAGGWAGKRAGGWKPRAGKVAPKTGRKAGKLAPKGKKDAAEWEQSLATACEQIKHSGDYGVCLYRPAEADPAKADVWWVMADGDGGTADDGTELSTSEEIKGILGAVEGVASVTVESEGYPPKDEGWRMVYPSAADWVSDPASAGGAGDGGGAPPADGGDAGKGKRNGPRPGRKDDLPVSGSAEHVADQIGAQAAEFLAAAGVQIGEGERVSVCATYPDSVILGVGVPDADGDGDDAAAPWRYFRVAVSVAADGTATLTGAPEPVTLELVVSDPATPAPPADSPGAGGGADAGGGGGTAPAGAPADQAGARVTSKRGRWKPRGLDPARKGRLGKKDTGLLKEAEEHLTEALQRQDMKGATKTLVARAADLVTEVVAGGGAGDEPDGQAGQEPGPMPAAPPEERAALEMFAKLLADPKKNAATLALMAQAWADKFTAAHAERELGLRAA